VASGGTRITIEQVEEDPYAVRQIFHEEDPPPSLEALIDARRPGLVQEALFHVYPRHHDMLRLYWGLDSPDPMTYEAIGEQYGIGRSRVEQMVYKAIERLGFFLTEYEARAKPHPIPAVRKLAPIRKTPKKPVPRTYSPVEYATLLAHCLVRPRLSASSRTFWIDNFVKEWMQRHEQARP
jgi:hypothetical protein